MKRHLLTGMLLLAFAVPALADEPSKDDPSAKEKKICRTEPITGSRTRVNRICMTREQWDEVAKRTTDAIDSFTRNATSGLPTGKNPMGPGPN